ncbi:hypothetical protein K2E95_00210 [Pseudomonas sp. ERGC3:01]|nr:hypothetical protein [Pseudomonas sp. ERGC3:01]
MPHVFHESQPTPDWVAQADPKNGLIAFWVGDMNIYAALSDGRALVLAREKFAASDRYTGGEGVRPVSAELLDKPLAGTAGTLRDHLAATAGPGWLARAVWQEVNLSGDES